MGSAGGFFVFAFKRLLLRRHGNSGGLQNLAAITGSCTAAFSGTVNSLPGSAAVALEENSTATVATDEPMPDAFHQPAWHGEVHAAPNSNDFSPEAAGTFWRSPLILKSIAGIPASLPNTDADTLLSSTGASSLNFVQIFFFLQSQLVVGADDRVKNCMFYRTPLCRNVQHQHRIPG